MENSKISSAGELGSFNVESLIWNVPSSVFNKYTTLGYIVEEIIKYLKEHSTDLYLYKEANGIKKLCDSNNYIKYFRFINDLYNFFEYEG